MVVRIKSNHSKRVPDGSFAGIPADHSVQTSRTLTRSALGQRATREPLECGRTKHFSLTSVDASEILTSRENIQLLRYEKHSWVVTLATDWIGQCIEIN